MFFETIFPPLGLAFALGCVLLVIVPYMRGRRHLVNSWNLFLLGMGNYVGISMWQAGRFWREFEPARYIGMSDRTAFLFVATLAALCLGLAIGYYSNFGRTLKCRSLKQWPIDSTSALILSATILVALAILGNSFVLRIQVVTQVLSIGGQASIGTAIALVGYAWLRKPGNIVLFCALVLVLAVSTVLSLTFGSGRRPLLAVLLSLPIILYYHSGRSKNPVKTTIVIVTLSLLSYPAIAAFSQVRHSQEIGEAGAGLQRGIVSVNRVFDALRDPQTIVNAQLIGSDAVPVSLALIEGGDSLLPTEYFQTLQWILTNPIPRAWFPAKPTAIGEDMPVEIGRVADLGYVSWGVGIIGHCYHAVSYTHLTLPTICSV